MKKIVIEGVFIPEANQIKYITLAPAFIALALAGDVMAQRGAYGQLVKWIEDRIPLDVFADCRAVLRWACPKRLSGPYSDANVVIRDLLPTAFAIMLEATQVKPEEVVDEPVVEVPAPAPKRAGRFVKK